MSPIPTQSDAAANLLGVPPVLPLVAINHRPRQCPRSASGYKNWANKSTPEQPDDLPDVLLRLRVEYVDPQYPVLDGALDEGLHRGVIRRLEAQGGEKAPGELPLRKEQGERGDERGAVEDHHDSPGEPPRGPIARDPPHGLRRRLYLREQLLLRVDGREGEVQDHRLDELAEDPDRGSRDEKRGQDEAYPRLEVERGERRERLGEAGRLPGQAADDQLDDEHEGERDGQRDGRLEGDAQHVVPERAGGLHVGEPPAEELEAAGIVEPRQGEERSGNHQDDRCAEGERGPEYGDPAREARRQEERNDEEGDEERGAEGRYRVEGHGEYEPRE